MEQEESLCDDIFSTEYPLAGTYFTFQGSRVSGLFGGTEAVDIWARYNLDSGRYVLRAWERDYLIDKGDSRSSWEELREYVFRDEYYPGPKHRELGYYSCVFQLSNGEYYHVGMYEDPRELIATVRPHAGMWLIVKAAAIIDMW